MWLQIIPREPLLVGDVKAGSQFLVGRPYIPGRVLRGALALDLLRQGASATRVREVVGRLRLGNFFPAVQWGDVRYALPLPMTAMTCKRHPGFREGPKGGRKGHGVVDALLPRLAYRLLLEAGARFPVPFAFECAAEGCQGRMEPYVRFYSLQEHNGEQHFVAFEVRYHAQTRVALSRRRRAASEAMLYTASALAPRAPCPDGNGSAPVAFLGRAAGDDDALALLREALGRTAIGALHNRGYGRVQVEEARVDLPALAQRLQAFNETLKRLWADLRRLAANAVTVPEAPSGTYFSLDLLAPAVFRADGVPSLLPQLTVAGRRLEPVLWVTRPDLASGWSTAWGLPKPTDLAARAASTYVYRMPGDASTLLPELERIEQEGVGERRDESFGECLICHPFHLEVEER